MSYDPIPYPAWRYHATEPARIVLDEDADKALGVGWWDHWEKAVPAGPNGNAEGNADVAEAIASLPPVPMEDLAAEARLLGIKVDGRWSAARLKAEIDTAMATRRPAWQSETPEG